MKYVWLVGALCLLGTQTSAQDSRSEDKLLRAFYSTDEIARLRIIISFFDSCVVKNTGITDIHEAYVAFNKNVAENNRVDIGFPLDSVRVMFAKVGHPVWMSIWTYSPISTRGPDGLRRMLPELNLSLSGKYWQFMRKVGEEDELIGAYVERIQRVGDLSPVTFGLYFDLSQPVDFSQPANRLIAAVHYLTFYERQAKP